MKSPNVPVLPETEEEANVVGACVCCGAGFVGGGGACRHCHAPLGLSVAALTRKTPPGFLAVLGASGAGKSVFLGLLLDILSEGTGGLWGRSRSSTTLQLQEQAICALETRRFPEKTAVEADGWRWAYCEVARDQRGKKSFDLVAPDFAGESIAHEVEFPGSYPAIRSVVRQARGVLYLCDSQRVRDAALSEDMFAMRVMSYIGQQQRLARPGSENDAAAIPLGVVFTKCDRCPDVAQDPRKFATNNLPRLAQLLDRSFTRHRYFAASVAGSTAVLADEQGHRVSVPFHTEPRGVVEPVEWLLEQSP